MRKIVLSLGLLLSGSFLMGQTINDASVLLVVGKDSTTRGKFMKNYLQNNPQSSDAVPDRKSVEEYLELYTNFRLKLEAAREGRYDTIGYLKNELDYYRDELAEPYLVDKDYVQHLYEEAYDHMLFDVRVRQILIAVSPSASPKDTLAAYQQALDVRKQILDGADFADMAVKYSAEYQRRRMNLMRTGKEGELGFFTAFNMIYPFEQAAYSLKVGELSMPVRSKYGYHLLQLLDKKPSLGKVGASHIMIVDQNPSNPKDTTRDSKAMIEQVYAELQNGADFGELAKKYSDDKYSGAQGGSLGVFAVSRMIPEVVEPLYDMKVGEYSKPVRSRFGWHIVRLDSKVPVGSFDAEKSFIENSVKKDDDRYSLAVRSLQKKMLEESEAVVNKSLLKQFRAQLPDTLMRNAIVIDAESNADFYAQTLVTYKDYQMSVEEALNFARDFLGRSVVLDVDSWFPQFIKECQGAAAIRYRSSHLESMYPEFKELVEEYSDGIYLFDINNKEVWAKAIVDSAGLEKYFEEHKDAYMTKEMVQASIWSFDSEKVKEKDVKRFIMKSMKKGLVEGELQQAADEKFGAGNLTVNSGLYASGENEVLDQLGWNLGMSSVLNLEGSKKAFAYVSSIEKPKHQNLQDVRGLVVSDYQAYLEDLWIKSLKEKYPVTVNKDVFESIFQGR